MSSSKKTLIGLAFVASTVLLVTALAIVSAREATSQEPSHTTLASAQTSPTPSQQGPVQVVRFTLYDVGIYPREAHVAAGLVAILIEDQSGGSSGVIVERVDGDTRVQQGRIDRLRSRFRARGELLLTAGRYEVRDADRANNKALLIVDAQ